VGLSFHVGLCCTISCNGTQYAVFNGFSFATTLSAPLGYNNLSTHILEAQLWSGNTLIATTPYTGVTLTFNGFTSTTNDYCVEYVLAPGASGQITTTLPPSIVGYLQTASGPAILWPEPANFVALTGTYSIYNPPPTATPTRTDSFTPTFTPTGTWPTYTPTPTFTYTYTVTPTPT
jgi:hypothetical protein